MPNVSPSDPRVPSRVPRRGLAALVLTATATALLFSFKTPADMFASGPADTFAADGAATALETQPTLVPGSAVGSSGSNAPPTSPQASESPASPTPATTPPAPATVEPPTEQVFPGQVVRTPYGLVQVEVTVGPSGITDVQALQLPYDRNYSARISQVVEPMLRDEALQAQSASIDLISGATYTSKGYAMSLQSALDQAAALANAPA